MVSGVANRIHREILVLDLGFLQTHHIRFLLGDPVEHNRQAAPDGIYVVGGDLHRDGRLGMLDYPARSRRPRICTWYAVLDSQNVAREDRRFRDRYARQPGSRQRARANEW